MIAGTGYVASSFAELVAPQYASAVSQVTMIMILGEFANRALALDLGRQGAAR